MIKKRIRIFIDMDGVLADFYSRFKEMIVKNPHIKFPQSQYGFFEGLDAIKDAIETYLFLAQYFDVRILTAPSHMNPLCYTGKRVWVETHLGMDAVFNMNISKDKSQFIGDYLIDDNVSGNGQEQFQGKLIHFDQEKNNWMHIKKYFINTYPEYIRKTA